jgi:dihydrolipoamide dehydrogenase
VLPFDEKRILSSTDALSMPEIPKEMVVLGAGVIGLELGSVYKRLGTKVTVIEFLDRITPTADLETAKAFQKILAKQGLKFMLSTKCLGGENKGDHVDLHIESNGERSLLKTDYVLVAIGRSPNTAGLNLEAVGIATDERGRIIIDEELRTPSHSHIYAIGDCVTG